MAISSRDQRAYTVIVVAGLTRQNKLVIVDVSRFRGDGLEILDEMFRIQQRWNIETMFVEDENISKALGPVINQEMIARNIWIDIETMTPTKDKPQRAKAIQTRMRAGAVSFDYRQEWWPTLRTEMATFPRGKYMDQVDAMSWIGLGLNKLVPTYTSGEIAQFEYEDEFGDEYDDTLGGKDAITGY